MRHKKKVKFPCPGCAAPMTDIGALITTLKTKGNADPSAALEALSSLRKLCDTESNKTDIGDQGGCEAVASTMATWAALDKTVVQQCCIVLSALCDKCPSNLVKFAEMPGINALLLQVLNLWAIADAEFAGHGCLALSNIVDENRGPLGRTGACETAMLILKTWGLVDNRVADEACGVVWNLAVHQANRDTLGNLGACEQVTEVLKHWGKTKKRVAGRAMGAMFVLSMDCPDNKARLVQAGAKTAVEESLQSAYKEKALMIFQ